MSPCAPTALYLSWGAIPQVVLSTYYPRRICINKNVKVSVVRSKWVDFCTHFGAVLLTCLKNNPDSAFCSGNVCKPQSLKALNNFAVMVRERKVYNDDDHDTHYASDYTLKIIRASGV